MVLKSWKWKSWVYLVMILCLGITTVRPTTTIEGQSNSIQTTALSALTTDAETSAVSDSVTSTPTPITPSTLSTKPGTPASNQTSFSTENETSGSTTSTTSTTTTIQGPSSTMTLNTTPSSATLSPGEIIGLAVGVGVGGGLLVIAIIILIVVFVWRCRKKAKKNNSANYASVGYGNPVFDGDNPDEALTVISDLPPQIVPVNELPTYVDNHQSNIVEYKREFNVRNFYTKLHVTSAIKD
jgi:hypothetical protein